MKHIMAILVSVFSLGYHRKTIDFEKYSPCHRTTIAHFLNKRKWDDDTLENIVKTTVVQFIYKEAQQSGKPVFCIVDDTSLPKQSLCHGPCTRLKMHIFTSLIKGEAGLWASGCSWSCSLAITLYLIMLSSCMASRSQR